MIDIEIGAEFPDEVRVDVGDDCDYLNSDEAISLAIRLIESAAILDRVEATRDRFTNYSPRRHCRPTGPFSLLLLANSMKQYRTSLTEALLRPATIWGIS